MSQPAITPGRIQCLDASAHTASEGPPPCWSASGLAAHRGSAVTAPPGPVRSAIPLTCAKDRRCHRVTDEALAAARTTPGGRPTALCGITCWPPRWSAHLARTARAAPPRPPRAAPIQAGIGAAPGVGTGTTPGEPVRGRLGAVSAGLPGACRHRARQPSHRGADRPLRAPAPDGRGDRRGTPGTALPRLHAGDQLGGAHLRAARDDLGSAGGE